MCNNYDNVNDTLNDFIASKKIPNIIFHGDSTTKKEKIVIDFVNKIYNSNVAMKDYVMSVDCAHGKGIKFVREDVKLFAKTNVSKNMFKSIILFNADKLTIDAQSALRRLIEIFSHSTRFFMIVDNISRLLNPILSRFCNIYVYQRQENLYHQIDKKHKIKSFDNILPKINTNNIFEYTEKIYHKGLSGLNLLDYLKSLPKSKLEDPEKYFILFYVNRIKKDIRDEKLLILTILNFYLNKNNIELNEKHYIE
jgi:DNA polymerase III delta prime subunit